MRAHSGISDCRGFTLVELLVALTLMALVLGLLSNSLRFSVKAADVVESKISDITSFHQSQRALRRQLQQMMPIRKADVSQLEDMADDVQAETLDFAASRGQLEYIAPLPGLASGGGLYRISLRIENDPVPGGLGGKLIIAYRPLMEESQKDSQLPDYEERILLQDFSRARFGYLDTRQATAAEWVGEWKPVDRLPDIVRLSMNFGDAISAESFDLIVAVKSTTPARFGTL